MRAICVSLNLFILRLSINGLRSLLSPVVEVNLKVDGGLVCCKPKVQVLLVRFQYSFDWNLTLIYSFGQRGWPAPADVRAGTGLLGQRHSGCRHLRCARRRAAHGRSALLWPASRAGSPTWDRCRRTTGCAHRLCSPLSNWQRGPLNWKARSDKLVTCAVPCKPSVLPSRQTAWALTPLNGTCQLRVLI